MINHVIVNLFCLTSIGMTWLYMCCFSSGILILLYFPFFSFRINFWWILFHIVSVSNETITQDLAELKQVLQVCWETIKWSCMMNCTTLVIVMCDKHCRIVLCCILMSMITSLHYSMKVHRQVALLWYHYVDLLIKQHTTTVAVICN